METAEDLIFTLDRQGNFLIVNKNGALMLGYTESEMIGKHFLEFVKEDNKADVALAFQKILASEDVVRFEAILVDIAGNEIVLEIQARSVRKNGEIDGVMAIGRDITERILQERELKDLNARLIEANRIISIERDRAQEKVTVLEELNRLKNEFISNVSHELRTPLASIVGFAEAITSDPEMPREMIDEFNNIIYTEGKRLAKLINDILDFSKLDAEGEKLEKKDFDFVPLLKELVEIYTKQAVEKGVELNAEIPETEIIIHGDRERLSNAIGHIISNAVKFTDKGGRVTVLVNNFLKDAEVIVSDTGIGIPKEELPELFQKFSKINRPGSQVPGAGLGLAMAKKIIDLHNGLINVKSEVNKGTTFVIRLPKKI
jgi:PAS domain S-box-containing protein